jgi:hypothetical protein
MGSIIKMYSGTLTGGTQDALASIDVPMPGNIVGVQWACSVILAATDFSADLQLSFRGVGAFITNDDRGIISEVRIRRDLTTSGDVAPHVNVYFPIPDLAVMGGERLYLHALTTASTAGNFSVMVHFDFDLDKISTRRR